MNIQEATKLAMERGKSIYRSSEFETFRKPGDNLELLPTSYKLSPGFLNVSNSVER